MPVKTKYFSLLEPLKAGGQTLDLSQPRIMGILNLTPDSFFDGGRYDSLDSAVKRTGKMLDEGADIIDIGGMSSRPGAKIITPEEEAGRIIPVFKALKSSYPDALFSIDTIYASTAKMVIELGAFMINDISGGTFDSNMDELIASTNIPYVVMHMQGVPANMQSAPNYENVLTDVYHWLWERTNKLKSLGATQLITDPGFGFGKTLEQNYSLVAGISTLSGLGLPILVGVSRKSVINKLLGTTPETALNGTTALHMALIERGASILRVHDVKAAHETIAIYLAINKQLR